MPKAKTITSIIIPTCIILVRVEIFFQILMLLIMNRITEGESSGNRGGL